MVQNTSRQLRRNPHRTGDQQERQQKLAKEELGGSDELKSRSTG